MIRKALFLVFVFTIPIFFFGKGQSISALEFLQLTQRSSSVSLENAKIEFLSSKSLSLPWIDDVELRTRTNRFLLSRQEYIVRISPLSFGHRKWQNQTDQASLQLAKKVKQVKIEQELEDHYQLLLSYANQQPLQAAYQSLEMVHNDQLKYAQNSSLMESVKLNTIINAQKKLNQVGSTLREMDHDQQLLSLRLHHIMESAEPIVIRDFEVVNVSTIQQILNKIQTTQIKHPSIEAQEARIDQKEKEYRLEKARAKRIFDFAQALYEDGESEQFTRGLSVTAGFRLPLIGNNKADLNELRLERALEEAELSLIQNEVQHEMERKELELKQAINNYLSLLEFYTQSDLTNLLENDDVLSTQSVSTILNLKEEQIKLQIGLHEMENNIIEKYIELLHAYGMLAVYSETNFIDQVSVEKFLLNN